MIGERFDGRTRLTDAVPRDYWNSNGSADPSLSSGDPFAFGEWKNGAHLTHTLYACARAAFAPRKPPFLRAMRLTASRDYKATTVAQNGACKSVVS